MEDAVSCSSRGLSESSQNRETPRKRREKVEVFQEVLRRLREWNDAEANQPGFENELWSHFSKLPLRYALDVNIERAQDVVMHKNLLQLAHYHNTRPAVEVRLVQIHRISDGNIGDSINSTFTKREGAQGIDQHGSIHPPPVFGSFPPAGLALEANTLYDQDGNSVVSGNSLLFRPSYEITISTLDKPKLLFKLTSLLSEIGLNIQEAHAFSTTDGYSLDVFVVDGWVNEETDQLRTVLLKEIFKIETQSVSNQDLLSPKQEPVKTVISFTSSNMDTSSNDREAWEIDAELLKYEHKIATGSTGDLYKGEYHRQEVAIKVLKAECLNEAMQRDFSQEVYILRKVRHKNIVQFIGACTKPPILCIITEFMSAGSLYDFLHRKKGFFKIPSLLNVAIDISKGMSYLHQHNIIHRDLKTANLLMDQNQVVKVADFGVARVQVQSGVMTAETGTYRWMAPEVITHRPYDRKADVFSFGIVLWELITGKLPYEHLTPLQAAVAVVQKGLRPTIPAHTHPMLVELLEKCWQEEPSSRPEFSEILEILQHMTKKTVEEEKTSKRRSLG